MPGRDGTGPSGQGPMTGRKKGLCRSSQKRAEPIENYVALTSRILSGLIKVFQNKQLNNRSDRQIEKR